MTNPMVSQKDFENWKIRALKSSRRVIAAVQKTYYDPKMKEPTGTLKVTLELKCPDKSQVIFED